MTNALKGLILSAGVIITAIVIGLGFFVVREARSSVYAGVGQISTLNKEFADADKIMYDGLSVSGSEVINVINKFKLDDISIKVITKKSTVYYNRLLTSNDTELGNVSTALVSDAQLVRSAYFINQKASFMGKVLRDINNTPIAIEFTQN